MKHRAAHEMMYRAPRRIPFIIAVLIVSGGAYAAYGAINRPDKPVETVPQPAQIDTKVLSKSTPDETVIDTGTFKSYTVAPQDPRYLRMPSLGVAARVMSVEATGTGDIVPTQNIFDVGWLSDTARPGVNTGVTVIIGHTSGIGRQGSFTDLANMQLGDAIEIERGDGVVLKYKVDAVELFRYDKFDIRQAVRPYTPGKAGLNLVTAPGPYNIRTNTYEDRIVVYTTLLDTRQ